MSVTRTYTVTVVSTGSGNKYFIDGVQQDTLNLAESGTFKFDQSNSSNGSHPLRFSTTSDGTHNSGSEYTTGVTTSGTPGSSGAHTTIAVTDQTPSTLYYQCSAHAYMGNYASVDSANITSSGAVSIDAVGDVTIDADGGDIVFKDAGTTFGSATNTSGDLILKSGTTTALTFSGANATVAGNLVVTGNHTVNGTTTTVNSTTLTVADKNITVAQGAADAAAANTAGLTVDGASATLTYTSADDRWNFNKSLNATLFGNVTGNVTGNVSGSSGSTTGNAATATTAAALTTARTLSFTGDVTGTGDFDGSGNLATALTIAANSVALGTDTTGNYMSQVSGGDGITISHTQSEGSTATITGTAIYNASGTKLN